MKIACDRCERILTRENGGLEGIRTLEGLDDGDKWCLCDRCFEAFIAFLGCREEEKGLEGNGEQEKKCMGYGADGGCLYMRMEKYGCDGVKETCPLPDDIKRSMEELGL